MRFPEPVPGLVIRYEYLWHDERLRDREEGTKARPCMVVVAVRREAAATLVTVAPITRRSPGADSGAIELSANAKRRIGLDDTAPSWIITSDVNVFAWPGPDVRAVSSSGRFAYGMISRATFYAVRNAIMKKAKDRKLRIVRRE